MLQLQINGQRGCKISIYNKEVRSQVKNKSHQIYDNQQVDKQTHDVVALDEEHALLLTNERYPIAGGFVTNGIIQIKF